MPSTRCSPAPRWSTARRRCWWWRPGRRPGFGGIAAALAGAAPPSAFERGLHQFGLLILRLTVFLVLFVLLVHLAFGRPGAGSFLFAVALAVGLTPELLPMVMTVTLSRGALRMAQKQVVVKRLAAIHDLGAMDVLCTDKTGTLTEANITLVGHPGFDGADSDRVLTLAAVNAELRRRHPQPARSGDRAALRRPGFPDWRKLDEIPFDFERRLRVRAGASTADKRLLIAQGRAGGGAGAGGPRRACRRPQASRSTMLARAALDRQQSEQAALRLPRCSPSPSRHMPADAHELRDEDERDLIVRRLLRLRSIRRSRAPPRRAPAGRARGARQGHLRRSRGGGAPSRRHAEHSGARPAYRRGDRRIDRAGADCARARRSTCSRACRPTRRRRIIRALQARGHTVGFIGDGVNDAPAIHAAEVGLSVEAPPTSRAAPPT